jgi:hypothetical protein
MGKGAFLEYIGKEAQTNRHKQTKKILEWIWEEARFRIHRERGTDESPQNNKMMSDILELKYIN